jgi:hypothetical protein
MHHAEFSEAVTARYEELHPDAPRKDQIALRCEVARDMLAQEPKEVQERLDAECRTAHESAVAEWEKEEEEGTLPSCDEEIQAKWVSCLECDTSTDLLPCRCREEFLLIVAPLLAGLRAYTGYTINIVAGQVNGGSFNVVRYV